MEFTSPRATNEEVLAFCSAVREAGGGNPLDALLPAVPEAQTQCLIARNLNFNCSVAGHPEGEGWVMVVTDAALRDKIAKALDLVPLTFEDNPEIWDQDIEPAIGSDLVTFYAVVLPSEIAEVAIDFDRWIIAANQSRFHACDPLSSKEKELLRTFTPLVEAATRETYKLGDINERGELVLYNSHLTVDVGSESYAE